MESKNQKQNKNQRKLRQGLTLFETLIYLAIVSLVISSLLPTLNSLELLQDRVIKSGSVVADRIFIEVSTRDLIRKRSSIISPRQNESSTQLSVRLDDNSIFTISGDGENNLTILEDDGVPKILNSPDFFLKNFNLSRDHSDDFQNFETIEYRYDTDFIFGTSSVVFITK